ncbi:ABC transporter ATP-binding protein [Novosphingobium aquae]|uniref:ABC transporter ATP-binding protein n=1 Tax=Novosphingobium aquae TaxID=3133435 RepID=A0ABU8SDW6_9SPHN
MQAQELISRSRPYRWMLALTVFLSLLGALASLAIPWFAARLLGGLLERGTSLAPVAGLLVTALFIQTIIAITNALVSGSVSARVLADFRGEIHAHLQRLPLGFHDQSDRGDLLSLMAWDASRLSTFISHWLASAISSIFLACGSLAVLFSIDFRLALVMPFLFALFFMGQKLVGRKLRSISAKVREAEVNVIATAQQTLEMLPATKAFAREQLQDQKYAQNLEASRNQNVRQSKILAYLGPANQLLIAIAVIVTLLLVSRGSATQSLSATDLFGFLLYAALLSRPIGLLANLFGELNGARGSLERLLEVLKENPEPGYNAPSRLDTCRGIISFCDVWFGYPGRQETLCGANLEIKSGEIVALTGDNGSGKTTLAQLLLGFYSPQRGTIRLDGLDIEQIQVQDLRRLIGYVPQQTLLFNASVRDNIGWGAERPDEQRLMRAARLSQALEFIESLPEGFDTVIGEHGVRLSGGQRQRLALARALLNDPPILILDEATSMYDLDGEAAFVEACQTALVGRTVLLITHRPASLELADRQVHLQQGKLEKLS